MHSVECEWAVLAFSNLCRSVSVRQPVSLYRSPVVSSGLRLCLLIFNSLYQSALVYAVLQLFLLGFSGLCRPLPVSSGPCKSSWCPLTSVGFMCSAVVSVGLDCSPEVSGVVYFSFVVISCLCWSPAITTGFQ